MPTPTSDEDNPFLHFTDAHLSASLLRAIRTIGILALVATPLIWIASGWQTACLFLVGGLLSAAGIYESRRLIAVINAKLDRKSTAGSTSLVIVMFFVRLAIAAGVLYVSLKWLHGSVYGVVAGLALAMIALSIEAVKLTRI
jgi:hypothetical protein